MDNFEYILCWKVDFTEFTLSTVWKNSTKSDHDDFFPSNHFTKIGEFWLCMWFYVENWASKVLSLDLTKFLPDICKKSWSQISRHFHTVLSKEIFRQFKLVKALLSRILCQKNAKINFRNFSTPQCSVELAEILSHSFFAKISWKEWFY